MWSISCDTLLKKKSAVDTNQLLYLFAGQRGPSLGWRKRRMFPMLGAKLRSQLLQYLKLTRMSYHRYKFHLETASVPLQSLSQPFSWQTFTGRRKPKPNIVLSMRALLKMSTQTKLLIRNIQSAGWWCWNSVSTWRIICGRITRRKVPATLIWCPSLWWSTRSSGNVCLFGACLKGCRTNSQDFSTMFLRPVWIVSH